MTAYYAAYALFALAVVLLAITGRASLRTGLGCAVLGFGLGLMLVTWGRPKPMWLEAVCQVETRESNVLAAQPREAEGRILLWLQAGECEPTAYQMPYSHAQAEALAKAMDEAERNGTGVKMLFEPSLEARKPRFHATPQQALPPKPEPAAPIIVPEEAV